MSDYITIGPECFADKDAKVICWKGDNYYKACDTPVTRSLDGITHCVKPSGHPSLAHEDYLGQVKVR